MRAPRSFRQTLVQPQVQVVQPAKQARINRRPSHSFNVWHRPFVIQPFFLAPVLPGETMKQLLMQARVVSDPVKNKLVGAHLEYFFFYVKFSDLIQDGVAEELKEMVLDPDWTPAAVSEVSASLPYYFAGGGINWAKLCTQRCVEEYFRDEGEAWNVATLDGLPLAALSRENWANSLRRAQDYVAEDVTLVDEAGSDTLTASELEQAMMRWELEKSMGFTDMSYEDYLASHGVRTSQIEAHKPELIRYLREWTYPSNSVITTGDDVGQVTSAYSWSIQERADKDRYFAEPGFLVGLTTMRPKVYWANQSGSAAWHMSSVYSWMPAMLQHDPRYRIMNFAEGAGPLGGLSLDGTDGYWIDVGDLLLYGDQFVNHAMTAADDVHFSVPTVSLAKRFPTELDVEGLFVDDATDGTLQHIRQDGIVSVTIAGSLRDVTPRA